MYGSADKGLIPFFPRLLEADIRVDPKRKAFLFAQDPVFKPPPFPAAGGYLYI